MYNFPVYCEKCNKKITVTIKENGSGVFGGNSYEIICSECGGSAGTVVTKEIIKVEGGSYISETTF